MVVAQLSEFGAPMVAPTKEGAAGALGEFGAPMVAPTREGAADNGRGCDVARVVFASKT